MIKTPGKLLRTVSCGSQEISAWPKSLLSTLIHVVKILDESVSEIPNLSAISLLSNLIAVALMLEKIHPYEIVFF